MVTVMGYYSPPGFGVREYGPIIPGKTEPVGRSDVHEFQDEHPGRIERVSLRIIGNIELKALSCPIMGLTDGQGQLPRPSDMVVSLRYKIRCERLAGRICFGEQPKPFPVRKIVRETEVQGVLSRR